MKYKFIDENINLKNIDIINSNNFVIGNDWDYNFDLYLSNNITNIIDDNKNSLIIDINSFITNEKNYNYILSSVNVCVDNIANDIMMPNEFIFYLISNKSIDKCYIDKLLEKYNNLSLDDEPKETTVYQVHRIRKRPYVNRIPYHHINKIKLNDVISLSKYRDIDNQIHTNNPFAKCLFRLMIDRDFIDHKKISDEELKILIDTKSYNQVPVDCPLFYNSVGICRQVFNNIIKEKNRTIPSRYTLGAITIGLRLNTIECEELYSTVGYYYNDFSIVEIITRDYIDNKDYDIHNKLEVQEIVSEISEILIKLNYQALTGNFYESKKDMDLE